MQTKLTKAFLAVAFIASVPCALFYAISSQSSSEQNAFNNAFLLSEKSAAITSIGVNGLKNRIEFLASSPGVVNGLHEFEEAAYAINSSLAKAGEFVRSVYVEKNRPIRKNLYRAIYEKNDPYFNRMAISLGVDNIIIVEANGGYSLYSSAKRSFFGEKLTENFGILSSLIKEVIAGKTNRPKFLGFASLIEGEPANAVIAAPIIDDRKIIGALIVLVSFEYLSEFLFDSLSTDSSAWVGLLSENGKVLSRRGAVVDGIEKEAKKAVDNLLSIKRRVVNIDSKRFSLSIKPLELFGGSYYIVAVAPARNEMKQVYTIIVISLLAVLMIAATISFFVGKSFNRRIILLSKRLSNLARGKRLALIEDEEKIGLGPIDEILVDLSQSIDNSKKALVNENAALKLYIDNLEKDSDESLDGKEARDHHHHKDIDLAELAFDVAGSYSDMATTKNIELTFNKLTEFSVVFGNEKALRRAIVELLKNGLQFTKSGGAVSVSVVKNGEFVDIEIADSGIGVSIDERRRIVESDGLKADGSKGGLYYAISIATDHGGGVGVEGKPGEGSLFTLRVPQKSNTNHE